MKKDDIDKKIGIALKKQMPAADNEWFTRRVLNRLPPKPVRSYSWIAVVAYIISLAICLAGWAVFIFSLSSGVILVKDVVAGAILFATTVALLWSALGKLLKTAEN